MSQPTPEDPVGAVAIVGMSGRFPGAPDIDAFWRNLAGGVESIELFSDDELRAAGVDEQLLASPAYVKAGGVCADEDMFDARYFGFSPREAQAMDPQQRVFLETAVAALEHAGLDPDRFPGPIGVYAGVGVSTYQRLIEAHPEFAELVGGLQVLIGTNKDHLTTHVSYKLNLRGPSVVVQTACSTSLVAVVNACQALLTFQCDAALAGGVSIAVPQREGYLYEVGGIDSPDGHCRAFDARAEGTVGGNGVGVVVLKRLGDARAAGDTIHAVIRGFAVNNDGAQKVGYTAPSIQGQAEVIALAQGMAGVDPDTISYVEAHGTGTALGDPIEIAALTSAFRLRTPRTQFCAIGSVKTNIGHLDCAAGVASLIKTVLALQHKQIPPSLHFTVPNPRIDFAGSPFVVNAQLRAWDGPLPRRAGVSSFGIGGTNAHVIVEEAPPAEASGRSRAAQLLTLSARTPTALQQARHRLAEHLESHPEISLADAAFTLHAGRREHEHRLAVLCRRAADAAAALRDAEATPGGARPVTRKDLPVAFVFPGQGSQYPGMARGLYEDERVFREAFDACAEQLRASLGRDIRDLCVGERSAEAAAALGETWLAQPALFSVQYAMARTWLAWGVRPSALLGHSVGEYTAACLAGVFTLEDALGLVATRGRLAQAAPRGAMLAVPAALADIEPLPGDVDLAAVNAPRLITVAGPLESIERFAEDLRARGIESKRLHTSHAFHSRSLDGILDAFRAEVARIPRRPPQIRYASNVTGTWITAAHACDPDYYLRQLRGTVRFADGVQTLVADGIGAFLEVGAGQSLTSIVRQQLPAGSPILALASTSARGELEPTEAALACLGQLWCGGATVDWPAFHAGERRRKVALPGYPFERQRFWIDAAARTRQHEDGDGHPETTDTSTRLYLPSWARGRSLTAESSPAANDETGSCWLLLRDRHGLSPRLEATLERTGRRVVAVEAGEAFERVDEDRYRVRRTERADYERLLAALGERGLWPGGIFHLWSLDQAAAADEFGAYQARGAFSLTALAQALMGTGFKRPVTLVAVTSATLRVLEDDPLEPARATILGLCRTIPQEDPSIVCRVIDVPLPTGEDWRRDVVERLSGEATFVPGETTVAYRGGFRWVQTYEPLDDLTEGPALHVRPGGTYLITGGLGRLGLLIARWLASRARVHLVLTSRTGLPPRSEWAGSRVSEGTVGPDAIAQVLEIESLGSTIDVRVVDVGDAHAMSGLVAEVHRHAGSIDGVVHCAGATSARHFRSVRSATPELWDEHFRPKVAGVKALARALDGHAPAFVVLMSSLSSVLGGLGFMPYAAANAFMDAYAEARPRDGVPRWISVNWDGWSLDDEKDDDGGPDSGRDEPVDGLTAAEGLGALERILAAPPAPQVLVVAGDLAPRLREWIDLADVRDAPTRLDDVALDEGAHGRPPLAVPYKAPRGELEEQLVALWQQLLGVAQVGVEDNFFELGGHSLLAIQLAARLRERHQIDLAVDAVFAAPTVAGLAREVERRRAGVDTMDDGALLDLVSQVELMDEGELRALLADDGRAPTVVPEEDR